MIKAAAPGRDDGRSLPAAYWEPLWAGGRRYRSVCTAEKRLMAEHLAPGNGRLALDIGSGDGALARHLHHELGYRTTGVDCSPSAVELAAAHDISPEPGSEPEPGPGDGPAWQCLDVTTAGLTALAHPAFALITCRLVYRWVDDKPAFLDQIRRILAPGGVLWVVTEIAGRRTTTDPALQHLGISPLDTELLTAGWSCVRTADLDVLRGYALRP
ncbi:class I SAM-dependent methyltransferase [Streptomyces sp. AC1-42W]|nr:class I SAM-dependent methyltransferase [Streptomyces sp. AC1-42T]PZT84016.1 class I SAM-dependent methyltransferase [Streptomyces sp. AC1-42W]